MQIVLYYTPFVTNYDYDVASLLNITMCGESASSGVPHSRVQQTELN